MSLFPFACSQCPFCGSKKIKCSPLKEEESNNKGLWGFFLKILVQKMECQCLECWKEWICLKGPGVLS